MIKPGIILFFSLLAGTEAMEQGISFSHINTTNGLSDNFIRSIVVDKNGFLWTGTNEGLNSWDGYTVTSYSVDEHPGLPGKTITDLMCDSRNTIWLSSPWGAAWAGPRRNFHRIYLDDTLKDYRCFSVFETKKFGPVLLTDKGQYSANNEKVSWRKIPGIPPDFDLSTLVEVMGFNGDSILFATKKGVFLFDYGKHEIIYNYPCLELLSLCRVKENLVALAFRNGKILITDIRTGTVTKEFDLTSHTQPRVTLTTWAEVRMAAGENIIYASNTMGFFIIDKDGAISRFTHKATDPHSIAANVVMRVLGTANGTVVVGTERYGLSVFNILKKKAVYQKFFIDGRGNFFDGFLTEIIQDNDGTFWAGSFDRLIHWNKKNNSTEFYQYRNPDPATGIAHPEIFRLCRDRLGQLWVSILGTGPALFDRSTGRFIPLSLDTAIHSSLKNKFVADLFEDSRGMIWAGNGGGFYCINPRTKKTITFGTDSLLKDICTYRTIGFAEDSQQRIWISTFGQGIYCYDPLKKIVRRYSKKDGLLDDICLDLMMDRHDNLFITMHKGFNIIRANGTIESYTRADGLRYDKTDAIVEDRDGMIWISNAKCLVRFDPVTREMDFFDEHENLNKGGFKPSSVLVTPEGELLWGTQSGINYFDPRLLTNLPEPLNVSIYQVQAGDSLYAVSGEQPVKLRYRDHNLQFYFVAIDLHGSQAIRYQYRLEGYDKAWQEGTDIRQARYSSLPPGEYTFRVRASADRKNWVDASSHFSLSIVAPVHMRWWFKVLTLLLTGGVLYFVFSRRNRLLRQKKEELETEKAIHYFASSMHEHQKVDDILWDVARNCIGRLQFEDCVIYLVDEEKKVLVQKAAHGPKSPRSFQITRPIDVPLGKGIVGSVAVSGKAEIIADTTKDPRYIVDDEPRLSEISVPMVFNGRVLGVIDCEHSKKGFFTQKHLSILSTIASLCANKIIRARTEEEKKQAENMLAETKHKMAEAEMQALRAQMNPHFIFNCLNSINRYIVKSDQATASLYLTRFAKLIRLILDNSHSKNVVLTNEIEALRLYIEMESLRFDNKFTYDIAVDGDVRTDSIEVPPLIIQPYIENAIWHGLLHRSDGGHLSVRISVLPGNMLQCIIEDNGVGREKARELKSKSATTRKSLGMELTENRLLLLNKYAEVHSSIEIVDIKNEQQEPAGTRVILKIPFAE